MTDPYQLFCRKVPQLEVDVDVRGDGDQPPPSDDDDAGHVHGRRHQHGGDFEEEIPEQLLATLGGLEEPQDRQALGQVVTDDLLAGQVEQEGGSQVRPRRVDAFHLLSEADGQEDEDGGEGEDQELEWG